MAAKSSKVPSEEELLDADYTFEKVPAKARKGFLPMFFIMLGELSRHSFRPRPVDAPPIFCIFYSRNKYRPVMQVKKWILI